MVENVKKRRRLTWSLLSASAHVLGVDEKAITIGIINSGNGMRLISLGQGLVGKFISLSFVALSEPSINPDLCGTASMSNTRTISIQALGLNLDMAKGDVRLKK